MAGGFLPFAYLSSLYITTRLLVAGAIATILSLIELTPNGYCYACSQRPFPARIGSSPYIRGTNPHPACLLKTTLKEGL